MPAGVGVTVPGTTQFRVTGPDGYDQTFTYSQFTNGEYVIPDLPTGTYSVQESGAAVSNYNLSVAYSGNGNVTKGNTATITVTNTYARQTGTLKIHKTYSGISSLPSGIQFKVTGPNGYNQTFNYTGTDITVSNLPTGSYTVEELNASVANYSLTTTYSVGNTTTATASVTNNGTVTVTVNNVYTRDTGTLTVTKQGSGATIPSGTTFNITSSPDDYTGPTTITYSQMTNGTWSQTVPTGTYTVVEDQSSANVTGYTLATTANGTSGYSATVSVAKNGSATVAFVNTYTRKTVKVKFVKTDNSAANPGMLSGAVFTVSSTGDCVPGPLTSGTNGILANASDVSEFTVPYGGSVVLTETDAPDGYMLMSGSVTVSVSLTGSVTVTNAGNPALDNGVYTIAISNTPGVVLPATGGIGTVPFTVIGLALMIASATMLVIVRKKETA